MVKRAGAKASAVTQAQLIRDSIVDHGKSVQDQILSNVSPEYRDVIYQVRSIYSSYKRADYDTIKIQLGNVYRLDDFLKYLIALGMVMASLNLGAKTIDVLQRFNKSYHELLGGDWFVKDRSRLEKFRDVSGINIDVQTLSKWIRYSKSLFSYVRNNAENRVYIWVLRQKRVKDFENDIRDRVFGGEGGNKVNKSIRTILRLLIHESNVPVAVYIARNSSEIKNYEVVADMYTSMVTIRSGSFEDIRLESVEKLKAKVALAKRCEERKSTNPNIRCLDEVVLKYDDVKGIVRSAAKASKDPILFERGAFMIGQLVCRDLRCGECVLKDVCKKYTYIKFK